MGYSSLLYAIGALAIGGLLFFSMFRSTSDADAEQAVYQQQAQAREAALTGLGLAARKLAEDENSWAVTPAAYGFDSTTFGQLAFRVNATAPSDTDWPLLCGSAASPAPPPEDRIRMTAVGYATTAGTVERHEIDVCYARGYASLGVPPAFTKGLYTSAELSLDGDLQVLSLDAGSNANVHSNGNLEVYGDNVRVEGHGTYAPGSSGTNHSSEPTDTIFDPNVDENGADPNLYEGELVNMPPFHPDHYRDPGASYCQSSGDPDCGQYGPPNYLVATDTTLTSGTIDATTLVPSCSDCGTMNNPLLYFVDGNLTISGDVTILGYLQFVVKGTVSIAGDVVATTDPVSAYPTYDEWIQANLTATNETTIGIYSQGDATVSSAATVVGQLYSTGTVQLDDGTVVIGGVSAGNNLATNGTTTIHFAQVAETNVLPGQQWNVPEGVRIAAYSEWIVPQ